MPKDLESAEEKNDKPGAYLGSAHREMFGVPIPMGYLEIMLYGWTTAFMPDHDFIEETNGKAKS